MLVDVLDSDEAGGGLSLSRDSAREGGGKKGSGFMVPLVPLVVRWGSGLADEAVSGAGAREQGRVVRVQGMAGWGADGQRGNEAACRGRGHLESKAGTAS